MNLIPLIGLVGLKQSGKDSAAAHLIKTYGFQRFALADPMREMLLKMDPIVEVDEWEDEYEPSNHGANVLRLSDLVESHGWDVAKETLPEVRRLLQTLGTEAGRAVLGKDIWVNALFEKVKDTSAPVVITDVRFPNEYDRVLTEGGILVRVVRPGVLPTDPHPSEALAADPVQYPADYVLHNDFGLESLGAAVDRMMDTIYPLYLRRQ